MHRLYRYVKHYILPPGLFYFLKNLLNKLHRRSKNGVKRLQNIKNAEENSTIYILGTGPSINTQDLSFLRDKICISVGEFYFHKQYEYIKPDYHVEAASHSPYDFDFVERMYSTHKRKISENCKIIIGYDNYIYSWEKYFKERNINDEQYYFVNYRYPKVIDDFNWSCSKIWDISENPFAIRSVSYIAIQLAVYLGASKINLIGFDHDYILNHLNLTKNNVHFYNDECSSQPDAVDYLKHKDSEQWYLEYYQRWKDYRLMAQYCQKIGVKICNMTNGGLLDVFARSEIE